MFIKEESKQSSHIKAGHHRYNSQDLIPSDELVTRSTLGRFKNKSSLKHLDEDDSFQINKQKKLKISKSKDPALTKVKRKPVAQKLFSKIQSPSNLPIKTATNQSTIVAHTSGTTYHDTISKPQQHTATSQSEITANHNTIKLPDTPNKTPEIKESDSVPDSLKITERARVETQDSVQNVIPIFDKASETEIAEQTIQNKPSNELDSTLYVEQELIRNSFKSRRSSVKSIGDNLDDSFLPISNSTLELVKNLNQNLDLGQNNNRSIATLDKKASQDSNLSSKKHVSIDSLHKRFKRIQEKSLQKQEVKARAKKFPIRSQRVSVSLQGVPYLKLNLHEDPKSRFKERKLQDFKQAQLILKEIKDRQNRKLDIQKELIEKKNRIFNRHDNADQFRDGDQFTQVDRMRVYELQKDASRVASPVSSNIRLNTHNSNDEEGLTSIPYSVTSNDLLDTQRISQFPTTQADTQKHSNFQSTQKINFSKGFEFTNPRQKFLGGAMVTQPDARSRSNASIFKRYKINSKQFDGHKTQKYSVTESQQSSLMNRFKTQSTNFKSNKPPPTTLITLYLVLLPNNGVKHGQIKAQCVRIKSPNFYKSKEVDFLKLCGKIFNQKLSLNFLFEQNGTLIKSMSQIKPHSLVFVKHDPGFNLTNSQFAQVIRCLDKDQRVRNQQQLSAGKESNNNLSKYQTASNYFQLVQKRLMQDNQLKTYELESHGQVSKQAVKNKLWKYAQDVMQMDTKLKQEGRKHYIDALIEARDQNNTTTLTVPKPSKDQNTDSVRGTPLSFLNSPLAKLSVHNLSDDQIGSQKDTSRHSTGPNRQFDLPVVFKDQKSTSSAMSIRQGSFQGQSSLEKMISPRVIEYEKEQFNLLNSSFQKAKQDPIVSKNSTSYNPDNKFHNLARRSVQSFQKLDSERRTKQKKLWENVEQRIEQLREIHGMTLSDHSSEEKDYEKHQQKLKMDQDPDDPLFNTDEYFNKIDIDLDTSDLYTNERKLGELYKAIDEECEKEIKAVNKNLVRFAPNQKALNKTQKTKRADFYNNIVTRNKIKFQSMNKRIDKIFKSNYKRLLWLNLPKLQREMKLDREHQIHNYMLWFAMTRLCALEETDTSDVRKECPNPITEKKLKELVVKGVSTDVIRKSIPMLQLESERFTEIMVDTILERSTKFVKIDPTEFMKTMRGVMHSSFEERLEVFFKMIDEDGNGELSWDELYELSYRSLNVFGDEALEPSTIEHLESMAAFFASYTFKIAGVPKDEEIPLEQLKEKIINGDKDEAIILSILMGA